MRFGKRFPRPAGGVPGNRRFASTTPRRVQLANGRARDHCLCREFERVQVPVQAEGTTLMEGKKS